MSRKIKRKKKGGVNKLRVTLVVLLLIIIPASIVFIKNRRVRKTNFYLKEIQIRGLKRLTEKELLSEIDIERGEVVTEDDIHIIEKKLMKNKWVKNVYGRRYHFGKLIFYVDEKKPIAMLMNNPPAILCADGSVIPYSNEKGAFRAIKVHINTNKKQVARYLTGRLLRLKKALNTDSLEVYFTKNRRTIVKINGMNIIVAEILPSFFGEIFTRNRKEFYKVFDEMKKAGYRICDARFRNQIIFEKGGAL